MGGVSHETIQDGPDLPLSAEGVRLVDLGRECSQVQRLVEVGFQEGVTSSRSARVSPHAEKVIRPFTHSEPVAPGCLAGDDTADGTQTNGKTD